MQPVVNTPIRNNQPSVEDNKKRTCQDSWLKKKKKQKKPLTKNKKPSEKSKNVWKS